MAVWTARSASSIVALGIARAGGLAVKTHLQGIEFEMITGKLWTVVRYHGARDIECREDPIEHFDHSGRCSGRQLF